jgi:fimbrial chaperone protein
MSKPHWRLVAALALATAPSAADAASLQVAPVLLEMRAPGATSTVRLRNGSDLPLSAQARVFRWKQVDGRDVLEPTDEVVASPPSVTLSPRVDYSIRVVRTSRTPVEQEESYRLLLDELPDPAQQKGGAVSLVLRHSIPVFFMPAATSASKLSWSVKVTGGKVVLAVTNTGGRRVRLAGVRVSDGNRTVDFGAGLLGYALAGSTMSWERPAPRGFSGSAKITATSDAGPVNASARVTAGR